MARYYGLTPEETSNLTWDQYHMLISEKEKVAKNLGEIEKRPTGGMTNKTAKPMGG